MTLDLVPIWTIVLALAVIMYVLLDGFDLGVGILFPFAPDDHARDLMMASVAPIWDGNETWLVLGGIALFAAFPLAFAIIIPAVYFPILAMLLGLIFRGVAFEFRHAAQTSRARWDQSFFLGSLVATFAQGCVLGKFVMGFAVEGRQYAGTSWDWVHPFVLAVGVGLVFGYLLLGATWLVLKTEGALQEWARRMARIGLAGVVAFIAMVSIWTPFLDGRIAARWFGWPNVAFLAPVPVATAAIAWWHGARSRAAASSRRSRRRWDSSGCATSGSRSASFRTSSPSIHAVGRRGGPAVAGLPPARHVIPLAGDPDVHRLVLLGVPREGSGGRGVSLRRSSPDCTARPGARHAKAASASRDRRPCRGRRAR